MKTFAGKPTPTFYILNINIFVKIMGLLDTINFDDPNEREIFIETMEEWRKRQVFNID